MSHSAKNVKEGTLFDFQTCILLQNNKKLKGGTLQVHLKIFEKSRTVPKKIKKGDPLASAGFVGYVKKVKNERGTLWRQKKFEKKSHSAEKNSKGGTH